MHYKALIESEYLGQWDLQKPDGTSFAPVVEIERVARYVPQKRAKKAVLVEDGKGGVKKEWRDAPNRRISLSFRGKRKQWLAGPVSQQVLATMFGPRVEDWIGKKITLYVDPSVKMGTQVTGGIRVKLERNGARGPITEDALDNAVDEEALAAIEAAKADVFADGEAES